MGIALGLLPSRRSSKMERHTESRRGPFPLALGKRPRFFSQPVRLPGPAESVSAIYTRGG
jgi:hypothetical protein